MNPKILAAIDRAIATRHTPLKCPNCQAAIRSSATAGTLALWVISENARPNGWLICRACWEAGISDTRMEKLIARVEAGPEYYIVNVAPLSCVKDAGYEALTPLYTDPHAAWSEDDRQWFEQHPGRSHRLRERFEGEVCDGYGNLILTVQIEPGVRLRRAVFGPPALIEQCDEMDLWEFSAAHTPRKD